MLSMKMLGAFNMLEEMCDAEEELGAEYSTLVYQCSMVSRGHLRYADGWAATSVLVGRGEHQLWADL